VILDRILALADKHGVPTAVNCRPHISTACQILERVETLFLIDYCVRDTPTLGVRFRTLLEKAR
jgi:hypothetical protein